MRVAIANPVVVTIPVNPLGGAGTPVVAQPPPERGPGYQNTAHPFNILVNGRVQPEIDDHQDAFFTTKVDSVYDAFGPSPADLERRFCMVEDRFKAMEGPDTFGLDATYMCLNYYQQGRQGPRRPPRRFDPIPMSYGLLLAHLLKDSLVQLREAKAPPVPLPSEYDMNVSCEYC
ncbi:hypothetical protein KIW84_030680 [Lathyrus oleraceus]|uniref:Uncharacterized protein n=1 Tax=Pisum sativum TaxID=3888 RepID=A0A9D4XQC6_PEA|nr:hypothetical protein KIW84_030680 [Pisum sativum]